MLSHKGPRLQAVGLGAAGKLINGRRAKEAHRGCPNVAAGSTADGRYKGGEGAAVSS